MDIFELLDKKFDLNEQIFRLNNLMFEQNDVFFAQGGMCTFAAAFEHELLCRWKYSYGRDTIEELLQDLNLNCIPFGIKPKNEKEAFGCLQLAYNMLLFAISNSDALYTHYANNKTKFFDECRNKIDYIISKSGMQFKKHPTESYYILVQCNDFVKSVAESQDKDIAYLLYEYTSPLLKNNINRKREILKLLSNSVYPLIEKYRKKYSSGLGNSIFTDLSTILNNFDIRHPNLDKTESKDFKVALKDYKQQDWEEIYDAAFELILDAFIVDKYYNKISGIVSKHKTRIENI